jgi:hypothetical protein
MPVLSKLEKTVKRIEGWQEDCASLQHAFRTLLGESGGTSVADVSVAPMPMGKKKKLDEAEMAGDIKDKDRAGRDVVVTPEGKTKRLTPQQSREMQRNDKESDAEGQETLTRLRKTRDILQTDQRLQKLIEQYWTFRLAGNFGRASEIKTIINEIATERDLDLEIVFASYDLSNGGKEEEPEPEEEEPEEDENKEDESEEEK